MITLRQLALAAGAFAYSLSATHTALADDIEIYVTRDLPADQRVRPNILFILDSSGSMRTTVSGTRKSRNQVVREVTKELVDDLKVSGDVNVGLMRFNSTDGGRVLYPVQRLTSNNATTLKSAIDKVDTSDWTPLSETLYEAYRYLTGQSPVYGGWSVSESKSGGSYISPIEHSCQRTNIIFLTDGEPTYDLKANSLIRPLAADNAIWKQASCQGWTGSKENDSDSRNGQCLPHLAEYMANQDMASGPAGKQTINTYTIGFATNQQLLKNTAEAGGGKYFTTSNVSGLTEAMKSIIVEILAENTSFAAPSVAVSAYNNLGYRNDLYYALFRPAEGDRWVGNVKRYKLTRDGNGDSLIVDRDGNAAVDPQSGFFRDTARSFWSSTADGKDVAKGGVAENLPAARTVYTWTGTDRTPTANTGVTGAATLPGLTDTQSLTNAMLGAANNTERGNFIKWGQGLDPQTNARRQQVADVLHNEPKLVAYRTDENLARVTNAEKSPDDPTYDPELGSSLEQLYLFFSSNEGFIHAVDASTGVEKFAFIPQELLPNLGAYYKDAKGGSKTYGMDGQIKLWVEYGQLDTDNQTRSLSKAFLYAGMRRGGRNYYALDVANLDAPKLKWVIKGGVTPGFDALGQSWAAPLLGQLKINGTPTKVLILSGGYDTNQDNDEPNTPSDDTRGNALFIVDADTGKLLWRAGSDQAADLQITSMTNSIPAEPALVDVDGNGLVDVLYAADTRGQIFRIDFDHSGTSSAATGGRIAALGGATAADNRRFYSTPDIALHRERGSQPHFTIAIGSGYRAHPLNEDTEDRFYVLRDYNVYSAPTSYTTLTEADLTDVSSVSVSGEAAEAIRTQLAAKEAQINALNATVVSAQLALTDYRASSGLTGKYQQWQQEQAEALYRQQQMEQILDQDPFVEQHAPESKQRQEFQAQIADVQALLDGWVAADPGNTELIGYRSQLTTIYGNLLQWQASLEAYQATVTAKETELVAARNDPDNADVDRLEQELGDLRQGYADAAAGRDRLNTTLPDLIAAARAATTDHQATLEALESAIADAGAWDDGAGQLESELLARDEQGKLQDLQNLADSQANDVDLLAEHEAERLTHLARAAALLLEIEALQAQPYVDSPALSDEQLAAAREQYGDDLTILEAYQFLLDQAIATASERLPGLRTEINGLYAQLQPGDNYTPNQTLLGQSQGWFMRLPHGEKVLSASTSYKGVVLFSTFSPRGQAVSTCGPDVGRGRYYALNLSDASGVFLKDDVVVRGFDLNRSGIPPSPSVILGDDPGPGEDGEDVSDDTGPSTCTATECPPTRCGPGPGKRYCEGNPVTPTYWREN
ncbi:MAG TPA: PilC/PilY family type IV pilus protein [Pseudomonas sp.]|uniref:PilC/PilY family type IV pilus protein n=1 Tax=Pseudomonas sp. TaxID=306 RepID=UPI002C84B6C0|nr:PilC/PilY family type IV pilus protein [Pseudomonas sp.]HTO19475.1 PilC/PilY family type IV pilus protein [Pseudomonas sp.]